MRLEESLSKSLEAGASLGWARFAGPEGAIVALDRFGASAPGQRVLDELGITADAVAAAVRRLT